MPAHDKPKSYAYIRRARHRPGFWRWRIPLSGTEISSEGLDLRLRKLKFRLWHRGIREMDLVMGGFADAELMNLSDAELAEVESWLDVPDQQMFAWVNGSETPSPELDTPLFRKLRTFHGTRP